MFIEGGGCFGRRCGCCDCDWGALLVTGRSDGRRDEGGGGSIGKEVVNMVKTDFRSRGYSGDCRSKRFVRGVLLPV